MSLVHLDIDAATGIARLTFNRPEVLNAIDVPLARALREQVDLLAADDRVRCVVLSGRGRAFMAGGDLAPLANDFDHASVVVDDLLEAMHAAIQGLRALKAPVVAAVQGAVAGAGLSLMAGCDLVLAAEGTQFLLAFDRVGMSPDCGATYYLPRLIGPRRAAELYLLGDTFNAQQAVEFGLVNRVLPLAELESQALQWAARVAGGPTQAYGQFKRLVQQTFGATLGDQLEAERVAVQACVRTQDFRAGAGAFMAKQAPRFSGR